MTIIVAFVPDLFDRSKVVGSGDYSPHRSPSSVCSKRSHPALLTDRGSKKMQPSGQANGACSAEPTRQRCTTSPAPVLRVE
jgi:hypothetical protein